MTREDKWKAYVESYDVEVPEEKIENEMNLIWMDLRHQMQYDSMAGLGTHLFPQMELEEKKDEIRAAAVFEVKSELVMKNLLGTLNITVSREELEAEAEAMAKRQNTTIEMVKGFFGEDLSMLERDVKERKAMDWVLNQN